METGVDVWVWLILLGSTLPVALAVVQAGIPRLCRGILAGRGVIWIKNDFSTRSPGSSGSFLMRSVRVINHPKCCNIDAKA
jgi:hypothetical protein